MKVLYIADFLYIAESGAHTSACAHMQTLLDLYGEENVKIISLVGKKQVISKYNDVALKGFGNPIALLLNCLCGYSTYLNKKVIKKILSIITTDSVDAVFIDNSIYGILVKRIKCKYPKIAVISYYHDVKASLAREWKKAASFLKKPVYRAMIYNEKLNQQYCDVNLVLNHRESELYKKYYCKIPEGELAVYMDIPEQDLMNGRIGETLEVLFLGGYYKPNVHGIQWFVEEVLPKLNTRIHLTIAGRGMERLVGERSFPDNVTVIGRVENLSHVYNKADIVISPIFEGGGMKVKVAEAMGYGKVVIGTDESYEGYKEHIPEIFWNIFFYRANIAEEYIKAMDIVAEQKDKLSKYNKAVRDIYEENYSLTYAAQIIGKAVNMALEKAVRRETL